MSATAKWHRPVSPHSSPSFYIPACRVYTASFYMEYFPLLAYQVRREDAKGVETSQTLTKAFKCWLEVKLSRLSKPIFQVQKNSVLFSFEWNTHSLQAECLWNALAKSVIGISCEDRVTNIEIMRQRGLQAETPWGLWWVCAWLKINMFRRWWNGFNEGEKNWLR